MRSLQLIFFLFLPATLLSQTKVSDFPLTFHNGNGPFSYINFPVRWEDTWTDFKKTFLPVKGIPKNLKNIKRGIIWFDPGQYIYQNYIAGKISKEVFKKLSNSGDISFNKDILVKNPIKCYVNLISATDERNKKVFIIDANNNYDFSDDSPFEPLDDSISDKELNKHLIKVLCQRKLNGKIINETFPLLIVKKGNYLVYSVAQYATATFSIGKKNYKMAVCPLYFYGRTWTKTQIVLLTDSLKIKKAAPDLIVNNGGFITIENGLYKFDGVDINKNTLALQKMSNNNEYSSQVGFRAPLFKGSNLLTGKNISLDSYKGKYVLIDFWGTWCQPCRQQLPYLVKLSNSSDSSRLVLISIATMDSLYNLKKVIAQEGMTWPQILSDNITKQYNVSAFPTNLLIDPNGIVIAKNLSMDDLKERLSKLALLNTE